MLDNQILKNINRADNIGSTLSHLSEIQNFLIQQISSMESSKGKTFKKH